jgi:hypothetical protein
LIGHPVATFVLWPKSKERTATTTPRGIKAENVRPLIGGGVLGAGLEGHF